MQRLACASRQAACLRAYAGSCARTGLHASVPVRRASFRSGHGSDPPRSVFARALVFLPAAVTLGLGVWQTQRLGWKERLIESYNQAQAQPPLVVGQDVSVADLTAASSNPLTWRRVSLTGTFDSSSQLLLAPRFQDGAPGAHVITALQLATGERLLVNRGWIPHTSGTPYKPPAPPSQPVHVEAVVRAVSEKPPSSFTPANVPEETGFWFWQDGPAMAQALRTSSAGVLDAVKVHVDGGGDAASGDRAPVPSTGAHTFRNDHLQYAITWYSLFVFLTAMSIFRVRRR